MEETHEHEGADTEKNAGMRGRAVQAWDRMTSRFSEWKVPARNTRTVRRIRMVLLFGVGIALGAVIKTEASPKLTMGFQDYLVPANPSRYDLNVAETNVAKRQAENAAGGEQTDPSGLSGAACGQ